jgi:DNA polymerase-3 subunit beta
MKFSCDKPLLLSAILTAARVAAAKSPVPELEGLLVEALESTVRISGYDLKTGITTTVEADVEESGSIVLNSRLFCDIIRKLPDGYVTMTSSDSFLTRIECEMSEFDIMGASAHNYPELPLLDEQKTAQTPSNTLRDMIIQTIFSVSDNESRPIHTGVLFEIDGDNITLVAVDGYRLALRRETACSGAEEKMSFVVPGAALGEVEKISSGKEEDVKIALGSKHVMFSVGNTVLISRRLEGEFLNYKESIPREWKYQAGVDKKAMIDAVERVALIINDKQKSPLRCIFGDGVMKLQAVSTLGRAQDECSIEGSIDDLEIGFNDKFLLDALRAAPADELVIRLSTGISPCVIMPAGEEQSFIYMILPVRLRANEG